MRVTGTASPRSWRRPDEPAATGVVILPDVRGLYRFYEELALRFAERGYASLALDYFGRTAGVEKRGDDFEYMEHVQRTTEEGVQADTAAAVEHLRGLGCRSVFTVGFCFGGRNSWLAAASGHGLAGAVGFYGMPAERDGRPGPTHRASEIEAPILALQAGDDGHITAEHNEAFEQALAEAGSSTRSSPTTAPRTASSTAARRTSPTPPRTPGTASSRSSSATASA